MPALDELERAAELHSIVRGNKNQGVVLQSFRESGFCAVVTRTRYTARILLVNSLRLHAPICVQPNLVNIRKDAEERIREAAAKSACPLKGHRNRYR